LFIIAVGIMYWGVRDAFSPLFWLPQPNSC